MPGVARHRRGGNGAVPALHCEMRGVGPVARLVSPTWLVRVLMRLRVHAFLRGDTRLRPDDQPPRTRFMASYASVGRPWSKR